MAGTSLAPKGQCMSLLLKAAFLCHHKLKENVKNLCNNFCCMRLSRFQNISYIIKGKHLKIGTYMCMNKVRGKIKGRNKLDRFLINAK